MMFHVVVLICGLSDRACTEDTALQVQQLGDTRSAVACMTGAQETFARLAIAARRGEYQKTVCRRAALRANRDVNGAIVARNE